MRNGAARTDRRAWLVTGALFAPLVLLLAVAVMTWRTERRYAVVTDRVIHDYAAIGAWQYARRASMRLHDEVMNAFQAVTQGAHRRTGPADALVRPSLLLTGDSSRSAFLRGARFAFAYTTATEGLSTTSSVDAGTRAMLVRRLREVVQKRTAGDEPHVVLFDSAGSASHATALWVVDKPDGPPSAIYGVVADPAALRPLFASVISQTGLLPGLAEQRLTEDDVAVRLTRRGGGAVFATRRTIGRTAATDSVGLQNGELHASVDLAPHVASALLVGGAPPSQLPALALMIALAAGLAVVALVHQKRLRELQRVRERFVANVSHDLRTPLAQISMFAETLMLGRERGPSERRAFASIILTEARRLTALVERVLHFSRASAPGRAVSKAQYALEPASLREETLRVVDLFAPIARESGVAGTTSLHDARVRLDRHAFPQILLNLLDNAAKHGGRGTVVTVATFEHEGGGANAREDDPGANAGEARIVVDDDGPGIPPEWRDRVFAPFTRMERTKVAGAGIGLSVVRDLVAAHDGRVWIEDAPAGGARFVIALPVLRPERGASLDHTAAAVNAAT